MLGPHKLWANVQVYDILNFLAFDKAKQYYGDDDDEADDDDVS